MKCNKNRTNIYNLIHNFNMNKNTKFNFSDFSVPSDIFTKYLTS